MSTALRSVGLLDVLSSTPAEPSGRAPCIHARLRRLATKPGEKSGLAPNLLIAEGFYRIEARGADCRVNPEHQADGGGDAE